MATLPRPSEPTINELKRKHRAQNFEKGESDYFGEDMTIKPEIMAKQGMISYLWELWGDYDVSYTEVQKATGSAATPIERWVNDEGQWSDVVERLDSSLDHSIQ